MTSSTIPNPATRPGGMERRARLMKLINVPMRRILGLPFQTPLSRSLMLISFTGRKTSKVYRQPVSYVHDGDVLLTPGGGRWKSNLHEGAPIEARLRGTTVQLRPELVDDVDEVERLVRTMIAGNPRAAAFMPFVGPGGAIDRERVEAAVGFGFRVVRWHLDDELPAG